MGPKVGAGSLAQPVLQGATGPGVGKQTRVDAAQAQAQLEPAGVPPGRVHLAELLATPSQPIGDPLVAYLQGLPVPVLLAELAEAVACGHLLPLERRLASAVESPILPAALAAADLARATRLTPAAPVLQRAGAALDLVSTAQQVQILDWLLTQRGVSIMATSLVEGAIAIRSGTETDDGADQAGGAGAGAVRGTAVGAQQSGAMPPPVPKGEWNPPGDQPIPLYVGSNIHDRIAAHYVDNHIGQAVVTNTTPIVSILREFQNLSGEGNAAALDQEELSKRPDILNLSLRHLYEIKPEAGRAQAVAKLAMYKGIMSKAGIHVELGPTGDPGVNGGLPAPAGTVIFECLEPGVITYQYRHSPLVPVPLPAPQRGRSRSPKWKWAFEADLTPDQRGAMVSTTVGGAILILLMVVLSPVGA